PAARVRLHRGVHRRARRHRLGQPRPGRCAVTREREETVHVVSAVGTHYNAGVVQYYLEDGAYGDGPAAQAVRDLLAQLGDEVGGSPMTTVQWRQRRT